MYSPPRQQGPVQPIPPKPSVVGSKDNDNDSKSFITFAVRREREGDW